MEGNDRGDAVHGGARARAGRSGRPRYDTRAVSVGRAFAVDVRAARAAGDVLRSGPLGRMRGILRPPPETSRPGE